MSEFERAVLEKLLTGPEPGLAILRQQLSSARLRSREVTGAGFYCSFDVQDGVPLIDGSPSFHFGDVLADISGLDYGAGFVLFVKNGRLDLLEGYSFEEPWPESIETFSLRYQDETRDLPPSLEAQHPHYP